LIIIQRKQETNCVWFDYR